MLNESVLTGSEKIIFSLRELFLSCGFAPYRMSKFEAYDLYAQNKDFLVSDNVITFTDTDGKLLALKPDVTLSIIKNSKDCPEETQKVFYNENVYRISKGSGSFKEIMQIGAECFGCVKKQEVTEVLTLAAESLKRLSADGVLVLSDLDILAELCEGMGLIGSARKKLYTAIGEKNLPEIAASFGNCPGADTLSSLLSVNASIKKALPLLDELLGGGRCAAYPAFREVLTALLETPSADVISVDFSVTGDVNYYNGIVFKGFLRELPEAVLSGGQYDRLMARMGRKSSAVGFAVYTDALERLEDESAEKTEAADEYVNVALPKGRLGEKVYEIFARAGFECPALLDPGRKLIFENPEKKLRFFWVKPSDVPIYVERGAADIGVAGKDILLEYEPDIYELLDLKKGRCRMAVAAPKGYEDEPSRTLRVATKFAGIAKKYYRTKGRAIDIIHLNGSIEIAPILKLSDVIVDIVETGTTLKENDLEVIETVVPISARLIANKASYKFKYAALKAISEGLGRIVAEDEA